MKKRLHSLSLHRETLRQLVGGKVGPGDDMSQIALSCAQTCTNCDGGGEGHLQSNTTCWC